MNKKGMACKVQNVVYLWERVTCLGNCQATVTQTSNHQSSGTVHTLTQLPVWVTVG